MQLIQKYENLKEETYKKIQANSALIKEEKKEHPLRILKENSILLHTKWNLYNDFVQDLKNIK